MKLLEVLQKELKEFPEGMLYAVQDDDGVVKFGKHSHPTICEGGVWQRREDSKYLTIPRLELAEDWNSAIVTKEMWDTFKVKSKMINTSRQGHVHANLMAMYAEDAKTTDKPWELWEFKDCDGNWVNCGASPVWNTRTEYRRKPKTHNVHGVEIPDIGIELSLTKERTDFYTPCIHNDEFFLGLSHNKHNDCSYLSPLGLTYPYTEEGKQAAILHAKAMLGIDPNTGVKQMAVNIEYFNR